MTVTQRRRPDSIDWPSVAAWCGVLIFCTACWTGIVALIVWVVS